MNFKLIVLLTLFITKLSSAMSPAEFTKNGYEQISAILSNPGLSRVGKILSLIAFKNQVDLIQAPANSQMFQVKRLISRTADDRINMLTNPQEPMAGAGAGLESDSDTEMA